MQCSNSKRSSSVQEGSPSKYRRAAHSTERATDSSPVSVSFATQGYVLVGGSGRALLSHWFSWLWGAFQSRRTKAPESPCAQIEANNLLIIMINITMMISMHISQHHHNHRHHHHRIQNLPRTEIEHKPQRGTGLPKNRNTSAMDAITECSVSIWRCRDFVSIFVVEEKSRSREEARQLYRFGLNQFRNVLGTVQMAPTSGD